MLLFRRAAFAAVLVLTAASAAAAQTERCTSDALTIDSAAVTARVCAPAGVGDGQRILVTVALVSSAGTVRHTTPFELLPGGVSRTVDDISLEPLGSKKSLHVTLAYRAGIVTLEHALLLPGAVPIK